VLGGLAALASSVISLFGRPYLDQADLIMIHLLAVVMISTRFRVGPSMFTAVVSALAFDYFFIPPLFAFAPPDLKSVVTFTVMLIVAGVISGLNQRLRRRERDAREAEVLIETERLRSSLLSAVSHDLKTPLTAILSAGANLAKGDGKLNDVTRSELVATVVEEAERLNTLVTNLLAMTRLESQAVEIRRREESIDEIIGVALARLAGRLKERPVHTDVPEEIPPVPVDPILVEQLFMNLLENAIRYTPAHSPLDIQVRREDDHIVVELSDRGPGVTAGEEERVFEKFFRGSLAQRNDGGVGLGLTICRAIVHAHHGRIGVRARDGGGATFHFTLPLTAARGNAVAERPAFEARRIRNEHA
jgi:two-component system sensor histidine kinase KdpD